MYGGWEWEYFEVQSFVLESDETEVLVTGDISEKAIEYIQSALSYFKKNKLTTVYFRRKKIHFHFSNNEFFKDGASMGIGIFLACYLIVKGREKLKKRMLVSGGVDLYGNLEEIGGIDIKEKIFKEKILIILYIPTPKIE